MPTYQKRLGNWGENQAINYLKKSGYYIVDRHWQRREGEIDIVALDYSSETLVFFEVKTRQFYSYGSPAESISEHKKTALNSIIELYIQEYGFRGDYRLDIIMITINNKIRISHLYNVSLE